MPSLTSLIPNCDWSVRIADVPNDRVIVSVKPGRREPSMGVTVDRAALLEALGAVERKQPRTKLNSEARSLILADTFGDSLDVAIVGERVLPRVENAAGHASPSVDLDLDHVKALWGFLGRHLQANGVRLELPFGAPLYFEVLRQRSSGGFHVDAEVSMADARARVEDNGEAPAGALLAALDAGDLVDLKPDEVVLVRCSLGGITPFAVVRESRLGFRALLPDPGAGSDGLTASERLTVEKGIAESVGGCGCDDEASANGMGA